MFGAGLGLLYQLGVSGLSGYLNTEAKRDYGRQSQYKLQKDIAYLMEQSQLARSQADYQMSRAGVGGSRALTNTVRQDIATRREAVFDSLVKEEKQGRDNFSSNLDRSWLMSTFTGIGGAALNLYNDYRSSAAGDPNQRTGTATVPTTNSYERTIAQWESQRRLSKNPGDFFSSLSSLDDDPLSISRQFDLDVFNSNVRRLGY